MRSLIAAALLQLFCLTRGECQTQEIVGEWTITKEVDQYTQKENVFMDLMEDGSEISFRCFSNEDGDPEYSVAVTTEGLNFGKSKYYKIYYRFGASLPGESDAVAISEDTLILKWKIMLVFLQDYNSISFRINDGVAVKDIGFHFTNAKSAFSVFHKYCPLA